MALGIRAARARSRLRTSSVRIAFAAIAVALAVAVAACGNGGSSSSTATGASGAPSVSASGKVGGSLTVWVDSVRLPAAQAYAKAHPNVKVHIVTFDGDANGATTLQTKIQLWNRTGSGWPDVIFSEQVNDPVWMAQKPFDFAAPVKRPHPAEPAQPVARAVDRPVHDQRHAVLRPGQPRPGCALGQQEADGPVRLHGSDDVAAVGGARPEGRDAAPRLRHRHHRGVVQPLDLLVGQPVPARATQGEPAHHQRGGFALHRNGQSARPADQGRDACRR